MPLDVLEGSKWLPVTEEHDGLVEGQLLPGDLVTTGELHRRLDVVPGAHGLRGALHEDDPDKGVFRRDAKVPLAPAP